MYCKLCGKNVDKLENGLCEECKKKREEYLNSNKSNTIQNNKVQFKISAKDSFNSNIAGYYNNENNKRDNDLIIKNDKFQELLSSNKEAMKINNFIILSNIVIFILLIPFIAIILLMIFSFFSGIDFFGYVYGFKALFLTLLVGISVFLLYGGVIDVVLLFVISICRIKLKDKLKKIMRESNDISRNGNLEIDINNVVDENTSNNSIKKDKQKDGYNIAKYANIMFIILVVVVKLCHSFIPFDYFVEISFVYELVMLSFSFVGEILYFSHRKTASNSRKIQHYGNLFINIRRFYYLLKVFLNFIF